MTHAYKAFSVETGDHKLSVFGIDHREAATRFLEEVTNGKSACILGKLVLVKQELSGDDAAKVFCTNDLLEEIGMEFTPLGVTD